MIKYKPFDLERDFVGEQRIEVVDNQIGQAHSTKDRYIARAIRILIECYDIKPRQEYSDSVPLELALEGNPSIAIYLCGARDYGISDVAEIMDISEDTVEKYIMRHDSSPYWSSKPDYEAKFEVE